MHRSSDSDRSERSARVLLFLTLCAAVLWALASAPAWACRARPSRKR